MSGSTGGGKLISSKERPKVFDERKRRTAAKEHDAEKQKKETKLSLEQKSGKKASAGQKDGGESKVR